MGFSAIVAVTNGDIKKAAIYILLAGVFDMLDGMVARLIKSASELGVELDSLCDAVSFGVAPSFMLYMVFFKDFGELGVFFASLPALAGVFRLARFNVQITGFEDKRYFTGLPIPAGAFTIISYIVFFHLSDSISPEIKPAAIITVTLVTALAMISRVKFDNLPRPSLKSFRQSPAVIIIFIIGLLICIITQGLFVFPFMMFYVAASSIRHLINWIKLTPEAQDDIDEDESD